MVEKRLSLNHEALGNRRFCECLSVDIRRDVYVRFRDLLCRIYVWGVAVSELSQVYNTGFSVFGYMRKHNLYCCNC